MIHPITTYVISLSSALSTLFGFLSLSLSEAAAALSASIAQYDDSGKNPAMPLGVNKAAVQVGTECCLGGCSLSDLSFSWRSTAVQGPSFPCVHCALESIDGDLETGEASIITSTQFPRFLFLFSPSLPLPPLASLLLENSLVRPRCEQRWYWNSHPSASYPMRPSRCCIDHGTIEPCASQGLELGAVSGRVVAFSNVRFRC